MKLKNKTALVTGASRGLGVHIARVFFREGANLILAARSEASLQELQKKLLQESNGQSITTIAVNLGQRDEINKLTEFREIDILVNNAAIQGPIGPLWENDWDKWQETFQINFLSPAALCSAYLPKMKQRNFGRIINLSGGGAATVRPGFSAYACSKTALVRLSETLAEEVAAFNISVNCVAPGMMNTGMLQEMLAVGEDKIGKNEFAKAKQKFVDQEPLIEPAAELCLYLAAQETNDISGKIISAVWDPWPRLSDYRNELKQSDIYTLRRIVPQDRGKVF